MLNEAGMGVVEAGSAEEAMVALQTAAIDILVTDVNLPGMSGPALAAHARSSKPTMGVVFATGDNQAVEPTDDALTAVLLKPYTSSALMTVVRAVLGKTDINETLRAPSPARDDASSD
jgi:DNA-binding NtrC family response regulator